MKEFALLYGKPNLPVFEVTGNQILFLSIHLRVKSNRKHSQVPHNSKWLTEQLSLAPLYSDNYLFVFWQVCEVSLAHTPF